MGQRETRPESRKTLLCSSCLTVPQLFNTFYLHKLFSKWCLKSSFLTAVFSSRCQADSVTLIGYLLVSKLSLLLQSCPTALQAKPFNCSGGLLMLCENSVRSLSKDLMVGRAGPGTEQKTPFYKLTGQRRVSSVPFMLLQKSYISTIHIPQR